MFDVRVAQANDLGWHMPAQYEQILKIFMFLKKTWHKTEPDNA
jgi:hypothetical protein